MDYLKEIQTSAPPPERPDDKPDDVVGDPTYPKEVVGELVDRARKKPESVDWALVAYELGLTPQELRQYLPEDILKKTEQVKTVEDREAAQKEKDEAKIKELAEAIAGFKKARIEKRKKLYEPVSDEHIEKALKHMRGDLGLRRAYQDIMVKNNREALEEKSEVQLKQLQQIYFGEPTFLEKTLPWKRKQVEAERRDKEERLQKFRQYLESSQAMLCEQNPEMTMSDQESQISNEPAYSNLALLDQTNKPISGTRFYEPTDSKIKKSKLRETGQMIMNDLDHMAKRTSPERTLGGYLNNVFDWKIGQEILATYFASVFESPEEAARFLNDPYNKNNTGWSFRLRPEKYKTPDQVKKQQSKPDLTEEEREDLGMEALIAKTKQGISSNARAEELTKKMAKIWDKTGIYPPLNLQVRLEKKAVSGVAAQSQEAA